MENNAICLPTSREQKEKEATLEPAVTKKGK